VTLPALFQRRDAAQEFRGEALALGCAQLRRTYLVSQELDFARKQSQRLGALAPIDRSGKATQSLIQGSFIQCQRRRRGRAARELEQDIRDGGIEFLLCTHRRTEHTAQHRARGALYGDDQGTHQRRLRGKWCIGVNKGVALHQAQVAFEVHEWQRLIATRNVHCRLCFLRRDSNLPLPFLRQEGRII
jgi:hypothetical protein